MDETGLYRRTVLRAEGITKRFGELVAVGGVDFDVPRHGIVSLIGPNGAGKTVFFNILTGLHKPDGGKVWFNGKEITGQPPDRVTALGIARTFQNIRLFPHMTVLENVLVGQHARMKRGIIGALLRTSDVVDEENGATTRSMDLLSFLGIESWAHVMASNLPYGVGRRLEIARALATDPQLLLLDEPTAGMNPQETLEMINLIARLRHELAIAILLIEHDMKVVMRISDRISVLDYGIKIAEGTPEQIRANPRVVEAYLGRGAAATRELAPDPAPEANARESRQINPRPIS
jgi:branched-chain amino acid transport system ATP-binding protein